MDHRVIKGVAAVIAILLHFGSDYLGDSGPYLMELAGLLIGWSSLRRPGDLEPLKDGL